MKRKTFFYKPHLTQTKNGLPLRRICTLLHGKQGRRPYHANLALYRLKQYEFFWNNSTLQLFQLYVVIRLSS